MSWLDLIISAWRILVNGTEQDVPTRVNYIGSVTAVKVGDQLNLTFAAPYDPYSVGIVGAGGNVPAGGSVVLWPSADYLQPWTSGTSMSGVAVNAGVDGESISVQSYGETAGINHALWAAKPTSGDVGSAVYVAASHGYTMTPNTTPGEYNQKIGIVWYADDGATTDTTTILLNIQPPVIVPAS